MTRPDDEVTDALADALEREDERRAERHDAHSAYVAWMGDRAERALAMLDDDALDEIRLDFGKVGPREKVNGVHVENARDLSRKTTIEVGVKVEDVERHYTLTGEMDAADLLSLTLKPARILVADLIAVGTTVLAAPPKIGKSWLCMQLAVECALGGTLLGREVTQGDVLYLTLEDGRERTQRRLRKVLDGRTLPRGRLTVRWDAPGLGEGMEAMIEEWLDAHPEAALVIVDTLGRVRTPGDGRRNAYQVDVQDVGRIQGLVRDRDVALIFVHHTKKGKEDDFVAQVSGTLGIAGSADTILIINRKRLAELATVEVTSRELEEMSVGARFADGKWTDAPEAAAAVSVERLAIYDVIRSHGPIFPVAIARMLRSERTSVQHLVTLLTEDGLIVRTSGGYVLADESDVQVH